MPQQAPMAPLLARSSSRAGPVMSPSCIPTMAQAVRRRAALDPVAELHDLIPDALLTHRSAR
jgi:hypothetical protein